MDLKEGLRQALHQLKLEEISNWLRAHSSVLIYNHEKGFTVVSKKYLEENPELRAALDKMIGDIEKTIKSADKKEEGHEELGYFG